MSSQSKGDLCFFALGDWGNNTPKTNALACAMSKYAIDMERAPDFILSLGDNFYPDGVESVTDPHFKDCWEDVFLKYENLRVPWKVVLGNHDYIENYQAQIDFSKHANNPGGLWNLPAKNYSFTHNIELDSAKNLVVDFFALDTNGAQFQVLKYHPGEKEALFTYKDQLTKGLAASKADYKIVFAHHALYTKGLKHGTVARCLRDHTYTLSNNPNANEPELGGYGLEDVMVDGKVAAYFSGHEHAMQHHHARGVHHFVCGATGAEPSMLYGGSDPLQPIDWVNAEDVGFAAAVVSADTMTVRFVGLNGEELHKQVIPRPLRA